MSAIPTPNEDNNRKGNTGNNNAPLLGKSASDTINNLTKEYHGVALARGLIWMFFGSATALLFLILSFNTNWYRRTPYPSYNIYYYPSHAAYSPSIADGYNDNTLDYNDCGSNGNNYDANCDTMKEIKDLLYPSFIFTFLILCITTAISLIFSVGYYCVVSTNRCRNRMCCSIFYTILKNCNYPLVGFYIFSVLAFTVCFIINLIGYQKFMNKYPYQRFCNFYNWDFTDDSSTDYCNWGDGINLMIGCTGALMALSLYCMAMLCVNCCGSSNFIKSEQRNQLYSYEYSNKYNNNNNKNNNEPATIKTGELEERQSSLIINDNNDNINYENLLTSIRSKMKNNSWAIMLCALSVATFIALIYSIICAVSTGNTTSDDGAEQYIDYQWDNAQCLNNSQFYSHPQQSTQCSFAYPDININVYKTCCTPNSCGNSFYYPSLLGNGYDFEGNKIPANAPIISISKNNNDGKKNEYTGHSIAGVSNDCMVDLQALSKASCHPLNRWFTPNNFNISIQPNAQEQNGVFICALFCKQTYDHCKSAFWSHTTSTIEEYFNDNAINFCENGLGVQVRSEIFTDHCFDAAAVHSIYVLVAVVFMLVLLV